MHLKLTLSILLSFLCSNLLLAQNSFDLISVDASSILRKFSIKPTTAVNITDRPGYDNQPKFLNDKQLVFSSQADNGYNDLIIYNFETGKFNNITRTETRSEFSPNITDCGQYISAVTVEEDSVQRLWLYPINMGEPEVLYDDIFPVGYYDWHDNKAAMFILGQPHNKLVYPYSREEVITIAQNVGRTVRKRPGTDEIAFINKNNNIVVDGKPAFEIVGFDLESRTSKVLGLTLPHSEDFIWINKNQLLMAHGEKIFMKDIRNSAGWKEIATIELPGLKNISRMALSPKSKKLVLVMERQPD
jgi:Tol biopolymer transport system component